MEYKGTDSEIKAGLGRIIGYPHPDAKPLYKKKFIDNGVETDIILTMGAESEKGVVYSIDAPSTVSEKEMAEMVENTLENERGDNCPYCEEASDLLKKIRLMKAKRQVGKQMQVYDEAIPAILGEYPIPNNEKNPSGSTIDDHFENIIETLGFMPINDTVLSPKELLKLILD